MIKINSISLSGIRGIRDLLTLDLGKKSALIFGENGSGKSSLTDGLEWCYSGSVEHLAGEEIASRGKGALRNLFISDAEDAYVRIQYSDSTLDSTKSLDASLKSSSSNTTEVFNDYLEASQSEKLILRYRDLVEFIIATKTEKLETLQDIIGFGAVADLRALLKKSATKIGRNLKSANFDNQKDAQQSVILDNIGQNAHTNAQFLTGANALIKPLKLNRKIESLEGVQSVLEGLKTAKDDARSNQISFYTRIGEGLTEIAGNTDGLHEAYKAYHSMYTELRKDTEKIRKLQLLALLKEGRNVLRNDVLQDDYCPICQQEKSRIELIEELNARITELEELEKEKGNLEDQKQKVQGILRVNINTVDSLLKEQLFAEDDKVDLLGKVKAIRTFLGAFVGELSKELTAEETIEKPEKVQLDKKEILALAKIGRSEAKALTESKGMDIKFEIYTKLFEAKSAYGRYQRIKQEQEILTNQQRTFQLLFADFIQRQEGALNVFLDMFSKEINEYYTAMNPNEKIEDITLVPKKDKDEDLVGITIEYKFFDETKTPPNAYLSESHINCLGLSFFLASVKAFNKRNAFIFLDDVISSFDRPHRARFAKLLTDKFSDYQILLLTHEREFFELIASDVKSKAWLIQDFKWSKDSGVETGKGMIDVRDRILKKFADKNTEGLGNDIRTYTEKAMKEIANNIDAPVSFRFNEVNERRMAPELLDAVQSRVSKKGSDLRDKANVPKLKGMPMFIGNTASHDNPFNATMPDLTAIWDDVQNTINVFYCGKCERFISMKYYDNVAKKIRCACGELAYDWKQ